MNKVFAPAAPLAWGPLSAQAVGWIAAAVTVAVWTAFIVFARYSVQRVLLPMDIAWLRVLGASMVLLPWGLWLVRRARKAGQPLPGAWGGSPLPLRTTALIGVFGGVGYGILAYSAFVFAPAAHGSVLMPGTLPLWTTLLAWWLLREQPSQSRAMGVALIVGGGLVVGGPSLAQAFDGGQVWKGDLLFMAAAACWAVYTVLMRRLGLHPIHATIAVTVFALWTLVPLYGWALWLGVVPTGLHHAPWGDIWAQVLFQGLGSVVVSGISFNLMVTCFGPVKSTVITSVVPGLSALAAVVLLGEPLGAGLVLGIALVTLGIVLGVRGVPALPSATKKVADSGVNTPQTAQKP